MMMDYNWTIDILPDIYIIYFNTKLIILMWKNQTTPNLQLYL